MKKILFKKIGTIVLASVFIFNLFAFPVLAVGGEVDPWDGNKSEIGERTGMSEKNPQLIAADIINIVLGFLGILAVVLIIYAGFIWMTAGGNEEKVAKAKSLLVSAIIGLIIILAAFSLATFVLSSLSEAI